MQNLQNTYIWIIALLCLGLAEARAQDVSIDTIPTRFIPSKLDSIRNANLAEILKVYDFSAPKITVIQENALLAKENSSTTSVISASDKRTLARVRNLSLISSNPKIHQLLKSQRIQSPFAIAQNYSRQAFLQLDTTIAFEERNRAYSNSERLNRTVNRLMTTDAIKGVLDINDLASSREVQETVDSPDNSAEEWYSSLLPDDCMECDESSDLFSPAVYLIYLLDFLRESFGETLDSPDEINAFFYTNFEELPVNQDLSESGSYVKYTNQVLENYLSVNYLGGNIIHSTAISANQQRRRQERIYTLFTQDTVPYPDLIKDQFEDYVSAFGTTRRRINFISRGSNTLINNFLADLDLTTDEFDAINVGTPVYEDLIEVKDKLLDYHTRKMEAIVRQEMRAGIDDEYRVKFLKVYREAIQQEIDDLLLAKLNNTPNFSEQQFNNYKSQAALCVKLGLECDSLDLSNGTDKYPLYPIRELYRNYARFFSDLSNYSNANEFAEGKFNQLRLELEDTYLREELLNLDTSMITMQAAEDSLRARVERRVEERLYTEDEFDRQLYLLDSLILEFELSNTLNKDAFDTEVARRAEEKWLVACNKAEIGFQEKLRANLLALIDTREDRLELSTPKGIEALADTLLVDLTIIETAKTTPFAFALTRIHTFVQKARLGVFRDRFPNLAEADEDRWRWLKSYGVWHAAMMVHLYPENFLFSDIDLDVSPEFETLQERYEDQLPNDISEIENEYKILVNEIGWQVCGAAYNNGDFHVFSYNSALDKIYHSKKRKDGTWTFWRQINTNIKEDFGNTDKVMPVLSGSSITFFSLGGIKDGNADLFYQRYKFGTNGLVSIKDQWTKIEDVILPYFGPKTGNNIGLIQNRQQILVKYTVPEFKNVLGGAVMDSDGIRAEYYEDRLDTVNWEINEYILNDIGDEILVNVHRTGLQKLGVSPNISTDIFGEFGVSFSRNYGILRWYVDSAFPYTSKHSIRPVIESTYYVPFNSANNPLSLFYIKDKELYQSSLVRQLSNSAYDYRLVDPSVRGVLPPKNRTIS